MAWSGSVTTTVTTMPRWPASFRHRPLAWLAAGAALVVAPKCLLCLAAYVGLATAVGLGGGREICGAPSDPLHAGVTASLATATFTFAGLGALMLRARRRRRGTAAGSRP